VAELAPGVSDEQVLTHARTDDAVLLTADKDFGELVHRQQRVSTGIVLIRMAGVDARTKAESVCVALSAHESELHGNFTVITPGKVRIRRHV
jgi:predicted nuclease of predicted toxin-antitoxin system